VLFDLPQGLLSRRAIKVGYMPVLDAVSPGRELLFQVRVMLGAIQGNDALGAPQIIFTQCARRARRFGKCNAAFRQALARNRGERAAIQGNQFDCQPARIGAPIQFALAR